MQSEIEPETFKFQASLPFALQSISPELAALHSSRARLLHPPEFASPSLDSFCIKCGRYLLDGSGSIRTARSSHHDSAGLKARFLRVSCNVCGHQKDIPIERGNAQAFTKVRVSKRRTTTASERPAVPREVATKVVVPPTTEATSKAKVSHRPFVLDIGSKAVEAKSRPKKKTGLQDMLARNRERREQEKRAEGGGRLAAFLDSL